MALVIAEYLSSQICIRQRDFGHGKAYIFHWAPSTLHWYCFVFGPRRAPLQSLSIVAGALSGSYAMQLGIHQVERPAEASNGGASDRI